MIRKANINDTEGLIKLLSQVHALHAKGRPDIFKPGGIKYTKENISEILKNENTPVFVFANEEDSVEGYVFCELKETAEDTSLQKRTTLYIDDLCVDENVRGKHIGTALYDYVVNYAKSVGADSITLNVWDFNESAKIFYEKRGLKPLKTIMEQIL